MTFWLGVAVAYVLILAVGLSLGLTLAGKFPGGGRQQWEIPDSWQPGPDGLHAEDIYDHAE
jgi:hypothetical protein